MDQKKAISNGAAHNRRGRPNEPPIPNLPLHLLSTTTRAIEEEESMVPQDTHAKVKQLERDLRAMTRERDDALDKIHEAVDAVILAEDKLDEEKATLNEKNAEINRLHEEKAQLLSEMETKNEELVNLRRLYEDQEKAMITQTSEIQRLQSRFDTLLENPPRNGTAGQSTRETQKDLEEKCNVKESLLQEMAQTTTRDSGPSQSRKDEITTQLEMLKKECMDGQQRWEAAEAQLCDLHEASLVQDAQAKDVAALRKLLTWHQTIGEQASKNAKQISEENRKLRGLIADKDKKLQGQEALLDSMRKHGKVKATPGSSIGLQ